MVALWCSRLRIRCGGEEVYVAAVALKGSNLAAKLVMRAAYCVNVQHFMVMVKGRGWEECRVYDFQPEDPENVWVGVAALCGREVSGIVLERKVKRLPSRKCWLVGHVKESILDATHAALQFNNNWETHLRIGHHDCRHYTQGLVEYLTGTRPLLDHLITQPGNTTTTH